MTVTTFNVPTIVKPNASDTVSSTLRELAGVSEIVINGAARLVQVRYDDGIVSALDLKNAIERAGYRVQRYSDGNR